MRHAMAVEDDQAAAQPLALDAALDPAVCGHEAAALAALLRSGHRVPGGFVIPVGGSLAPEVVREALERLGPGPYAVRSSGVAEDLADASFAGQYESVLGAETPEDVIAASERVRASGGTAHADRDGRVEAIVDSGVLLAGDEPIAQPTHCLDDDLLVAGDRIGGEDDAGGIRRDEALHERLRESGRRRGRPASAPPVLRSGRSDVRRAGACRRSRSSGDRRPGTARHERGRH
jgi:Pyruvate phosphate dikinase, AMP/ATP-binding domain